MNRLCMVLAHGGAETTVKRHLPIWSALHDRVIICSPADDPIRLPNEWNFVTGKSSRYATTTNERTYQAMRLASELRPPFLTFCEYDALLWHWPHELFSTSPTALRSAGFVAGSQFRNDDPKFIGKTYIHSPIIFYGNAIERVTVAMATLRRDAEHGFGDRYFGLAVERAGVPVINGHDHGLSYSQNHIERKHWVDATKALRGGAVFSHGIKDADTFAVLKKAAGIA